MNAAVVQAAEVTTRDGDPDVSDLHVGLFLGIEDRLTDALCRRRHVDDLPLADPP